MLGKTARALFVSFVVLAAPGCGDEPSRSGVEGSKPISSLTPAEFGTLCDWSASLFGGYGMRRNCTPTSYSNSAASREECLATQADLASCPATVAEFERCGRALHDQCLAGAFSGACDTVLPCGTQTSALQTPLRLGPLTTSP